MVLLLGGECKPLVPPQSPLPEGTGRQAGSAWNPQDEKRERLGDPHSPPAQDLPPRLHLQKDLVLILVLIFGGREAGRAALGGL